MIVITAIGFIGEKPRLNIFTNSMNCEFDVVATRREKQGGDWVNVYERASFVVWGEEAERVASRLDCGHVVTATGRQKTSKWTDDGGSQRSKVKYELLSWERMQMSGGNRGGGANQTCVDQPDKGADARRNGSQSPYQGRPPQPQRVEDQESRPPMRYAKPRAPVPQEGHGHQWHQPGDMIP